MPVTLSRCSPTARVLARLVSRPQHRGGPIPGGVLAAEDFQRFRSHIRHGQQQRDRGDRLALASVENVTSLKLPHRMLFLLN